MTFILWFYDVASLVENISKYNSTTFDFHNHLCWHLDSILSKEGIAYFDL